MSILIADDRRGLYLSEPRFGTLFPLSCELGGPFLPCCTHELFLCACHEGPAVACVSRLSLQPVGELPCVPGLAAMCASPCGRYLYQLSADADCVHTRSLSTGELMYSCALNAYPRDMRLHSSGRFLAVAGGEASEVVILCAPELSVTARIPVRGVTCALDFLRNELVLLCTIGEDDIQTILYTVGFSGGEPKEILRVSGPAGGLCACEQGTCVLMGTIGGLMKVDLQKVQPIWNLPQLSMIGRVAQRRGFALASSGLNRQVDLIPSQMPWRKSTLCSATDAQAIYI